MIFQDILAFIDKEGELKISDSKKRVVLKQKMDEKDGIIEIPKLDKEVVLSKMKRIKWAFVEKEVNIYVARLQGFKLSLTLFLVSTPSRIKNSDR